VAFSLLRTLAAVKRANRQAAATLRKSKSALSGTALNDADYHVIYTFFISGCIAVLLRLPLYQFAAGYPVSSRNPWPKVEPSTVTGPSQ